MKRFLYSVLLLLVGITAVCSQNTFVPEDHKIINSSREDGLYLSTYGVAHHMLKNTKPECAFDTNFTKREFKKWQKNVSVAMTKIMCHPQVKKEIKFIRINNEQKDGYRAEKWEFYPLEGCVSTFYVLIPDGEANQRPAVLCIPGSGMTKEQLIGVSPANRNETAMALHIVRKGYVAVAVDNATAGEASDLELLTHTGYDYDTPSRILLELGWSYLGYTSFLNKQVLDWMKRQQFIRPDRIVVSGFSLGTEPLMVLGALDASIYGFIYNDFLCQTQERALVMTYPDAKGRRPFPNSIRHLIPNFWKYFNFPDIVASLAPRHLILTEGGLDRDLDAVKRAYEISGTPQNVEVFHYAKFQASETRNSVQHLPEGLERNAYYEAVNVDGANHYFKCEYVLPWLDKIFNE